MMKCVINIKLDHKHKRYNTLIFLCRTGSICNIDPLFHFASDEKEKSIAFGVFHFHVNHQTCMSDRATR